MVSSARHACKRWGSVMSRELTVQKVLGLPFTFFMHLNRGKEHDRISRNEEYGLTLSQTSVRPNYRIVNRSLSSPTRCGDMVVDLLAPDAHEQLVKFVERYNRSETSP